MTVQPAVLHDTLGPRARRRTRILTVVAVALGVVLAALVVRRLAAAGQFAWDLWAPLVDPRDEQFSAVWRFLGGGLVRTLLAAALAIIIALALGTVLVCVRLLVGRWGRGFVVVLIELLRGVPVVLAIFFAARVLPEIGVDVAPLWYVVIGLVVYNSVVIAEVLRAGVAALPRGQNEAALAIGLTRTQTLRLVLLPQAFRIMMPALISQLVVVLKDTSLGFIVAYPELVRRAQILVQNTHNPIQTFLVVGLIYIVINRFVERVARAVEAGLSRSRAVAAGTDTGPAAVAVNDLQAGSV